MKTQMQCFSMICVPPICVFLEHCVTGDGALCAVVTVQGVLQCGAGVVTVQGLLRPHMLLLLLDTGLALSSSLPPHIAIKNFNTLVLPLGLTYFNHNEQKANSFQ